MSSTVASVAGKIPRPKEQPLFVRRARYYWHRSLGRVVELLGNQIHVDGLHFSLDSPVVNRTQKWSLFTQEHEEHERALLKQWLPKDLPVVEFGGALGVISCLTNRSLVRPEQHVVVEANPDVIPLLERNRDLNGCRFQVTNKAVAYDSESVRFGLQNWNLFGGRLGDHGDKFVVVPTTSLKATIDEHGFDQISLICDIEGAEAILVQRELETIRKHVRFFLVEIHPDLMGKDGMSLLLQTLLESGFTLQAQAGRNWAFTRN
jgi:FkbM family methyltransferase